MFQKILLILLFQICMITQLFAEDSLTLIKNGSPCTIEKYTKNSLYDNEKNSLLIEQIFEDDDCFEGYHPPNITVSAYDIKNTNSKLHVPIWQFKDTGMKGNIGKKPLSNLYIIQEDGCCGSGIIKKYYSLNTGNLIAYSSISFSSQGLLPVNLSSTSESRYIGVEDTIGPSESYEGDHIAIIFYSNSDQIIQKFIIMHPLANEEWIVDKTELLKKGLSNKPNSSDTNTESEFDLLINLWCRCNAPRIDIKIPILKNKLDIDSAIIEGDNRAKIVNIYQATLIQPMQKNMHD